MQTKEDIAARVPLFIRVVSLYVVIAVFIGLLYLAARILSYSNQPFAIPAKVTYVREKINYGNIVSKTIIDGEPQTFTMPRLGISLPVKYGYYDPDTNQWTASDDAIYYAYGTALPNNQRGNTFVYGHNRDSVIARLSGLVIGDLVTITTSNGHEFTYAYTGDVYVKPDYTSVLRDNPDTPRLTVMTCEGIWSLTRRLMYFDLEKSK